jgi:hypothetical protein
MIKTKKKTNIQKQRAEEEGVSGHRGLRQIKTSASDLIPCQQKQCGYMLLEKGCRACKTCKAEPYKINDKCQTCFDCEFKPGFVRWDNDPELKQQQEEFQKFKEDFQKVFADLMDKRRSEVIVEAK